MYFTEIFLDGMIYGVICFALMITFSRNLDKESSIQRETKGVIWVLGNHGI